MYCFEPRQITRKSHFEPNKVPSGQNLQPDTSTSKCEYPSMKHYFNSKNCLWKKIEINFIVEL